MIHSKRFTTNLFLTLLIIAGSFCSSVKGDSIQPPVPVICAGEQQQIGYPVCFDGSYSTGLNSLGKIDRFGIKTYTWDFGDGTRAESGEYLNTHIHTYYAAGTYTVTLRVLDYAGASASITKTITVGTLPKISVVYTGNIIKDVNAAIAKLSKQPGIVHIPTGTYKIESLGANADSNIYVFAGQIIEGEGKNRTILINTKSANGLWAFYNAGNNIRYTNLQIKSEFNPRINNGIYNQKRKNLYVDNCSINGFSYGLFLGDVSSGTFEKNDIYYNDKPGLGYGVHVGSDSYAMVRNNVFWHNRHSIASGGGDVARNTGYDCINNDFHTAAANINLSSDSNHVIDAHAGAGGRTRIINNTLRNLDLGITLNDGWGEIKGNSFTNVRYVLRFGKPEHNGNSISGAGIHDFIINENTFTDCLFPNATILDQKPTFHLQYGTNIYVNGQKIETIPVELDMTTSQP